MEGHCLRGGMVGKIHGYGRGDAAWLQRSKHWHSDPIPERGLSWWHCSWKPCFWGWWLLMISIFWWVEVLRTNKINMAPNLRHLKIEFLNNIKYIIGKIFTVLYNFSKVRPPRKTLICNIHISWNYWRCNQTWAKSLLHVPCWNQKLAFCCDAG